MEKTHSNTDESTRACEGLSDSSVGDEKILSHGHKAC